jgi:hypothetical protein
VPELDRRGAHGCGVRARHREHRREQDDDPRSLPPAEGVVERRRPGASEPTCRRGRRRDQAPVVQEALLVAASVIGKTR